MRCTECNVDLSEDVRACPLCGTKAANTRVVLYKEKTAEYPEIKYKPFKRNYSAIYFLICLVICAAIAVIERLYDTNTDIALLAAFISPCAWAVFLRPFIRKNMYLGDYLLVDLFFLSLLMLYISQFVMQNFSSALSEGIPFSSAASAFILLFAGLLSKRERAPSAFYTLILLLLTCGCFIMTYFYYGKTELNDFIYSAAASAFLLLVFFILLMTGGNDAREEIKARLHF